MPDDNLAILILCALPFVGLIFLLGRLSVRREKLDSSLLFPPPTDKIVERMEKMQPEGSYLVDDYISIERAKGNLLARVEDSSNE